MKPLQARNRINELMSLFVTQVKGAGAMSQTDINHVAETVLIPLLAEVYGLKHLENLNTAEKANFPGVDLGDAKARVAIQVTSTPDAGKIKDTLQKFVSHNLHEKFNRVMVYVLTEKQASYSGRGFDEIVGDRFTFDKERDIVDYRDLLAMVTSLQLNKLQRVERILEANFGNGNSLVLESEPEAKQEELFLNLLEMSFPDKLYIADLRADLGREARSLEEARQKARGESYGKRRKRLPGPRERVRQHLKTHGERFAVDWECHGGQILTFHDLTDESLALGLAIERESIEVLEPGEFYEQSEAQENVFRSLLHRCVQQKLYHRGVSWQNEEALFFFSGQEGDDTRREKWKGKKKNERGVYWRVMNKKDPGKVWYHKHLAFRTAQLRLGDKWFLLIKPDWFFSWDGYKTSFMHAEKVTWLKVQKERNGHVFNHLRMIVHLLTNEKDSTLFEESRPYRFLSFGKLLSFDNAPHLDDKEWLGGEVKEERQIMSDTDSTLSFDFDH